MVHCLVEQRPLLGSSVSPVLCSNVDGGMTWSRTYSILVEDFTILSWLADLLLGEARRT